MTSIFKDVIGDSNFAHNIVLWYWSFKIFKSKWWHHYNVRGRHYPCFDQFLRGGLDKTNKL